jgi:hypothetical protein
VKSHESSQSHKKAVTSTESSRQTTLTTAPNSNMLTVMVSDTDDVIKAEIIQALKIIRYHQSFRSCGEDSLMFSVMFPDSKIAQKYAMDKTKLKYVIEFGIALYIRTFLKIDMARTPYSFAFDETTTAHTKKQLYIKIY